MKEVLFAGFGGQGVLTAGLILANAAMKKDLMVSWMPSYGPAMRGGTANACVKYGEVPGERIGTPALAEADIALIMNEPSLAFLDRCKEGAYLFINSNGVPEQPELKEKFHVYRINSDQLALDSSNAKGTSIVMLGAMTRVCGLGDAQYMLSVMDELFSKKGKNAFGAVNEAAFMAGWRAADALCGAGEEREP